MGAPPGKSGHPSRTRSRPRHVLAPLGMLILGGMAHAQEWNDFHFRGLYGDLTLAIELWDEERSTLSMDLSQEEIIAREILNLGTTGYYYHPKLVEFDLRGSLAYEQQRVFADSSSSNTDANTFFPNWDLRTRFFKDHPYSAELYSYRSETYARRNFFPTTRTTVTETGANFHAKELLVPSRLHYHRYNFDSDGQSTRDQVRDNLTLTGALLEGRHQFSYGLEFNRVDQGQSNLSYDDYSGHARSTLFLGDDKDLRWNNSLRARTQQGNVDIDTLAGASQLYQRWSRTLNSDLGLQYNRAESGTTFNETTSLSAGINHQLYASLSSSANVQFGRTRLGGGNIDVSGGGGQLVYRKKTPAGLLGLRYDADYYVQDQDDLSGLAAVFDESHLYTLGVPIFLDNHGVDSTTVLVTDSTGLTVYTEGSDYILVPFGSLLRIDIPVGSLINPGDTLLVDYSFAPNPEVKFSNVSQTMSISFDFDKAADFMVSYSTVKQNLLGGINAGILTDSTRTSAAFNIHPYDATIGIQYEDYASDFAPFERTTLLASYHVPIRRTSLLRLAANTFTTKFDGQAGKERGSSASVSLVSGAGRSSYFQLTGEWHRIDNTTDEGSGVGLEAGWTRQVRALKLSLNLRYTDEEFVVASDQRIMSLFFTITRSF